uniref:DUF3511 domain-containing protein n=1 Tax=Nymphaea colorata TaxID=210225 RepID=A0A5K1D6U6_9MAGN
MGEISQFRTYGHKVNEVVRRKTFNGNQTCLASSSSPPPFAGSVACSNSKRKGASIIQSWGFNNAESKRRRRVASYKVYAVEGKVKASFRKGIRWIREKCSEFLHG